MVHGASSAIPRRRMRKSVVYMAPTYVARVCARTRTRACMRKRMSGGFIRGIPRECTQGVYLKTPVQPLTESTSVRHQSSALQCLPQIPPPWSRTARRRRLRQRDTFSTELVYLLEHWWVAWRSVCVCVCVCVCARARYRERTRACTRVYECRCRCRRRLHHTHTHTHTHHPPTHTHTHKEGTCPHKNEAPLQKLALDHLAIFL